MLMKEGYRDVLSRLADIVTEITEKYWEASLMMPSIVRLRYKLVAISYANLEFNSKIT